MERDGLIEGRWVGPSPRKKHVYSLTHEGRKEFNSAIRQSLILLMGAYNQSNIEGLAKYLPMTIQFYSRLAEVVGLPLDRMKNMNVVMAVGPFDPLVCYPNAFIGLSTMVPHGKVYVVKDPDMNFCETRPNMVILDGWRNDIPLKDGMADLLTLQGFPGGASEEETIEECSRVLKKDGHLIVEVMKVMVKEKAAPFIRFNEFVAKKYYEHDGKDRIVSLAKVKEALSNRFERVTESEFGDNMRFHAMGKLAAQGEAPYPSVPRLRRTRPTKQVRALA